MPIEKIESLSKYILYAACTLIIAIWGYYQAQTSITADLAFLTNAATHLLDGIRMSEGYFDTNPPMSIILYTPAAAMSLYFGIPLYISPFIYTCLALILSTIATTKLLQKLNWVEIQNIPPLIMTYILANTILVSYDFGEKEHLLIMALFPFTLVQFCISENLKLNKALSVPILLIGAFTLLVKPHFGLVPCAILVHRFFGKRRFKTIIDADFIALSLATITYALITYIFFYDFIEIILPEVMSIYTSVFFWDRIIEKVNPILLINAFLLALLVLTKRRTGKEYAFSIWCLILSFFAIIGFITQGKGLFYHLIPAYIYTFTCGFCTLNMTYRDLIKSAHPYSALLIVLVSLITMKSIQSHSPKYTHNEYLNSELISLFKESQCKENCTFFMLSVPMRVQNELASYTRWKHASRFPNIWFAEIIRQNQDLERIERFSNWMLEDLKKHTPDIILIGDIDFSLLSKDIEFDFMKLYRHRNTAWETIWSQYEYKSRITLDYKEVTGSKVGPIQFTHYDIFIKKPLKH